MLRWPNIRTKLIGKRAIPRILAVSSGGGHWVQLMRLRPAFTGGEVVYVTVDEAYRPEIGDSRFHRVGDATRWDKFALIKLGIRMFYLVIRERPDVVVSTGAAPGFFAVMLGKMIGSRTIWLDSMANVDQLSMCGARVRPFADLWLTQWEDLSFEGGPEYSGSVA